MSHPDEDLLAALALGDRVDTDIEVHVAGCTTCSGELGALRSTLVAARGPRVALVRAPASVWAGVTTALDEPEQEATPAPVAPDPAGSSQVATTHDELAARRGSRAHRRVGLWWVAGAAAAGLVFGAVGARVVSEEAAGQAPVTVASTTLDTLDTLETRGTADLVRADGHTDLALRTAAVEPVDGYLEVWLINTDLERMVSVGVLRPGETDQSFAVPQSLIDEGYVIVDISREGYDDKPEHSGDSVVRGTLQV